VHSDVIVVMDGALQHSPELVAELISVRETRAVMSW
jgi:hypothetical protein